MDNLAFFISLFWTVITHCIVRFIGFHVDIDVGKNEGIVIRHPPPQVPPARIPVPFPRVTKSIKRLLLEKNTTTTMTRTTG